MRSLGRLKEFDERSRDYPVRSLVGDAPTLSTKIWDCDVWLDQGTEGACVGFSWAHELAAEPSVVEVDETYARMIYREAQKVDEWPGEDYEGTSVLAGVKIVKSFGWIDEYRWGFSLSDVLGAVVNIGPVILGTNWYEGMWDTDDDGYIWPTGSIAGGHAIMIVGYDHKRHAVLLHNSWGQSWGVDGRAWVDVTALEFLLSEQGEVCVPLVRKQIDPVPEPIPVPEPEEPEPTPIPEPEPVPEPEEPEPTPEIENPILQFFKWLLGLISSWFKK